MQSVLAADNVYKRYGRRHVLRGATIAAHAGQFVAILGENGAGKSTLLRILAGAEAMDRGHIHRRGVLGYCPQDSIVYSHLTPDEHFELFGAAYGLNPTLARQRADEFVERFGLTHYRRVLANDLSGGTRQKLNVVIALLHDPDLLLLDEPYSGFDIEAYGRFMAWATEATSAGKCIVLITHLILDRKRFSAVLHLRDGQLQVDDV